MCAVSHVCQQSGCDHVASYIIVAYIVACIAASDIMPKQYEQNQYRFNLRNRFDNPSVSAWLQQLPLHACQVICFLPCSHVLVADAGTVQALPPTLQCRLFTMQGSQFSLKDVEVVAVTVDLDEVVSYRCVVLITLLGLLS